MAANMLRNWIKSLSEKLLGGGSRRSSRLRSAAARRQLVKKWQPTLETLEDRLVPSNNWVVTDASGLAGSSADITLPYAVANAQNGDTISFASSLSGATITLNSTLTVSTNVTITGLGAANLAVSGNNAVEVFDISTGVNASISSLTVENGLATGGGGIVNDGTLTLTNSTVSGNASPQNGSGGGIVNHGSMTLTNSTVSGNSAYSTGGGINNFGTLQMSNDTVSGNTANTGAGINNTGTLSLTNSYVTYNRASNNGGGIAITSGSLTLTNSLVTSNAAGFSGGAGAGGGIYADGTVSVAISGGSVSGGTISGNTAYGGSNIGGQGGGIYADGAIVKLTNAYVTSNAANAGSSSGAGYGGGIAIASGSLTLTNSNVSGNIAGFSGGGAGVGGGIYAGATVSVVVSGGSIGSNTAYASNLTGGKGGGVFADGASVKLTNVNVDGNSALGSFSGGAGSGGGIYVASTSSLTISGGSIVANNAGASRFSGGAGGGIYAQAGYSGGSDGEALITISGGAFIEGNVAYSGSALRPPLSASAVTPNAQASTTIRSVAGEGGNVYIGSNWTATISNSTFSGGSAGEGGGIYAGSNASVSINGGQINYNYALSNNVYEFPDEGYIGNYVGTSGRGGGIFADGATIQLTNVAVLNNAAVSGSTGDISAGSGGGIYLASSSSLTISGGSVSYNRAGSSAFFSGGAGGGIYAQAGASQINISGTSLIGNTAQGAFFNFNQAVASFSGFSLPGTNSDGPTSNGAKPFTAGHSDLTPNDLLVIHDDVTGNAGGTGGAGGGVYLGSNVTASITNSVFSGGSAGQGGGVYNAGILNLANSSVTYNTAFVDNGDQKIVFGNGSGVGGGIFNSGTANLVCATISGNVAATGGGVYSTGVLSLTDSHVSGNLAGSGYFYEPQALPDVSPNVPMKMFVFGAGGGIYNSGTLTLGCTTVSCNTASSGGGIFNTGTLTLNNSGVFGNTAADNGYYYDTNGDGGGIDNYGTATVVCSTISCNTASSGGGIFNAGTLTLANAKVSDNTAGSNLSGGGYGGGISNTGTANLANSTISCNGASFAGGIANGSEGTLSLNDVSIYGNWATGGGGIGNNGTLTLSNSSISSNSAYYGGGIATYGIMTMNNSTVSGNTVSNYAGGIANGGFMTLSNSTITGNTAYTTGGGIGNNLGTATLSNVTVSGNSSPYGTGGIAAWSGSLTILNSIVAGNSSGDDFDPDVAGLVPLANYSVLGPTVEYSTGTNDFGFSGGAISPLASNGGPTQTMALLPGSIEIGNGGALTNVAEGDSVGVSDTTIYVNNPASIAATPGDYYITIDSEEMLVTNVNLGTDALTVVRGVNGTTAATHNAGDGVFLATDQRGNGRIGTTDIGAYQLSSGPDAIQSAARTSLCLNNCGVATLTFLDLTKSSPTGVVEFLDTTTNTVLGDSPVEFVNGNYQACVSFANLPLGVHVIQATYEGDDNFQGSSAVTSVYVVPTITPSSVSIPNNSTSLTINGTGFDTNTANDNVIFNDGVIGSVTAASSTSLTVSLVGLSSVADDGTPLDATVIVDSFSSGCCPVEVATVGTAVPVGIAPTFSPQGNVTYTAGSPITNLTAVASGTPAPSFSESGSLPGGLSFSDGVISGTPALNSIGTYAVTFTAGNDVAPDATETFSIVVTGFAPTFTPQGNVTYTTGTTITNLTAVASGDPAPSFTESGSLPGGLSFASSTGVISGTPALNSIGTYPITFTASNGIAPNATETFSIIVQGIAPVITVPGSETIVDGVGSSFLISATANPAATFTAVGLPAGVTLTANSGVVSWPSSINITPPSQQPITVTFTATNAFGSSSQTMPIYIDQAPLITSSNSATFTAGSSSPFTVTASGYPASTFTEVGTLPGGVSLSSGGVLSGAAATVGTYPITIYAANGINPRATQSFTLKVTGTAPSFTAQGNVTYAAGSAITNLTAVATGNPSAMTYGETGIPSGLSFSSSTGVLSGIPALSSVGTYPVTFTAANGVAPNATETFSIIVTGTPPVISVPASETIVDGTGGSFSVTATGNPAPTFTSSGLPVGVTLSPTTGLVNWASSVNAAPGVFGVVTFTATNSAGSSKQTMTIYVDQAPAFTTSTASATVAANGTLSYTPTTTGYPTVTFTESGTIPPGVTFSTSTGALTGHPTAVGTSTISIVAANGVNPKATQTFTLVVSGTAPTFSPAQGNVTYTAGSAITNLTASATGNPTPTYTESGALPSGLNFSNGVLSGTPTLTGTYPITFTAGNGISPNATETFSILVIGAPPVIVVPSSTVITDGTGGSWAATVSAGSAPITYSAVGLPTGVIINANNGVVSWPSSINITPPVSQSPGNPGYLVTFTATNSAGSSSQTSGIYIDQAPLITSAATDPNTTHSGGVVTPFTVTASGYPAATFTATGLPTGITLSASGVLGGTAPTVATTTTYHPVFTATNGVNPHATQTFTLIVTSPQLLAGAANTNPNAQPLTQAQLSATVAEAIRLWAKAGISPAQIALLRSTSITIGNLESSGELGDTANGKIVIDATADGDGWYVSPNPFSNNGFTRVPGTSEFIATTGPAAKEVDLLTVVMHEMGHILGLPDLNPSLYPDDVMTQTLGVGIRRLPTAADALATLGL